MGRGGSLLWMPAFAGMTTLVGYPLIWFDMLTTSGKRDSSEWGEWARCQASCPAATISTSSISAESISDSSTKRDFFPLRKWQLTGCVYLPPVKLNAVTTTVETSTHESDGASPALW